MKDRDNKLIWEQYTSPGRNPDPAGGIPFSDGRGEMGPESSGAPTKFGFPYAKYASGNKYTEPRPEFQESDETSGEILVQGFGPDQATRPLEYPNHNPLGAELEPGPMYNAYVEWSWDGEDDPGGPTSPPTEPYVYNAEVTSIRDEDDVELVNDPAYAPIKDLVADALEGAGVSVMVAYGWNKPTRDDY